MWCNWFLNVSPLQPMPNRGNSSLTHPVHSTICRQSGATRTAGTALKKACIHNSFPSYPLLPSLRIEANAQSKAVTSVRFLRSQESWHEDWKWCDRRSGFLILNSIHFLILAVHPLDGLHLDHCSWCWMGMTTEVSQVFSTITDFIWRPNYKQHHDECSIKVFILIILSEIIFDMLLTIDLLP